MQPPDHDLRDALLDPASYPWRPATVECIDTHVSRIFLAGDRVVKIKRPVELGFIDLRRADARHAACVAEDTLNRRLTEGVYLGLAAITRRPGGVRVGGDGARLETAVVMRRLPESHMLDRMIERGAVPPDAADRIADRLIPFYRSTARCGPSGAAACAGAQVRVVRENVAQIAGLPRIAGCGLLQDLIAESVGLGIRSLDPLLRLRCSEGWVRDGHGDLRAEHVCLEPGRPPQLFDCLEFAPSLRCADVASDLAFLLMDLHRRGAASLADAILGNCRRGGISLPDPLLRFYATHRALVRIKVGLIEQAEGLRGGGREIAGCLDEAAAASLDTRPVLVIVSGLSGSGKSLAAGRIARAFGLAAHSSDEVRQVLVPERDPELRYRPDRVALVYDELFRRAAADLATGRPALLDATFLGAAERERAASVARDHRVPLIVAEVEASDATALRRIRSRAASGASMSDADEAVHAGQRERVRRFPPAMPDGAFPATIDNEADGPPPLDPVAAALRAAGVLRGAFQEAGGHWRAGGDQPPSCAPNSLPTR
ncbi:MAG: AAA family ATPase [Chloroflexota bacterium]